MNDNLKVGIFMSQIRYGILQSDEKMFAFSSNGNEMKKYTFSKYVPFEFPKNYHEVILTIGSDDICIKPLNKGTYIEMDKFQCHSIFKDDANDFLNLIENNKEMKRILIIDLK